MNDASMTELLNALKDTNEDTRNLATQELWRRWFLQKGAYGLEFLERSQQLLETRKFQEAECLLTELIQDQPDFAEAWNRRAVLHYIQSHYQDSLNDCQQVVNLNPVHFGAWHGMGLCHAMMGNYVEAIQAFRQALEIQPHTLINQKLILECTAKLN